jgi:hypothetical protein
MPKAGKVRDSEPVHKSVPVSEAEDHTRDKPGRVERYLFGEKLPRLICFFDDRNSCLAKSARLGRDAGAG